MSATIVSVGSQAYNAISFLIAPPLASPERVARTLRILSECLRQFYCHLVVLGSAYRSMFASLLATIAFS